MPDHDLHAHTTASDGLLAPRALVERAARAGVRVLAVTDHDTLVGLPEAQSAALAAGLRLVPGIEISARAQEGEVHLLGHLVDPGAPALRRLCEAAAWARTRRMETMVERARAAGLPVSLPEVLALAGPEGRPGRPHLARLLVEKGVATSLEDAFARFLSRGRAAFAERTLPDTAEALAAIHEAGGLASLAHPALGEPGIRALAAQGLDALETAHPSLEPRVQRRLRKLARELGLATTGGSDFHGDAGDELGSSGLDEATFAAYEARSRAGERR